MECSVTNEILLLGERAAAIQLVEMIGTYLIVAAAIYMLNAKTVSMDSANMLLANMQQKRNALRAWALSTAARLRVA